MAESNDKDSVGKLSTLLERIESSLDDAKRMLQHLTTSNGPAPTRPAEPSTTSDISNSEAPSKIIEGIFDGQNMIGPDGKTYPVPANYASKSKLVQGDNLKLTIAEDGSFIYKQIKPVDRKKLIGTVNLEEGQYTVTAGGKTYKVLFASVTYFKAQPGDQVTIVIPIQNNASWAAIEAVIGA